jgi:pimeloyl-ACP methyl ester carboxylesterase
MAFASINGAGIHYRVSGRSGNQRIVFVNSLGTDMAIWADVEAELLDDFEMLFFDKRGHGLSEVTPDPYSIAQLSRDLAGLLNHCGWRSASVCGVSIGGMIAMQFALDEPSRLDRLILMDTAAKIGNPESFAMRIGAIESQGMAASSEQILNRWFPPSYRTKTAYAMGGLAANVRAHIAARLRQHLSRTSRR